jgi:hypothetical protein
MLGAALGPAAVRAAEPSVDHLRVCMSENDDARRLACYDREMGRHSGGAPADFGITPELMRKKQVQAGIQPEQKQKETLSAKVAKVVVADLGRVIVTLDNGQVWSQTETLDFPVKAGVPVTIEPGVLGGVWMEIHGGRRRTHVKRIG